MRPRYFRSASELRRWLRAHHSDRTELWIGYYKKGSAKSGITYREAVDEALCFGWIDGVARGVDGERYMQRFTPRKARSYWSTINIQRARELIEAGRMEAAGLEAFERRAPDEDRRYSFEQLRPGLGRGEEKVFRADRAAWEFFSAQPPGYRRTAGWWVVSAKREETRRRRLERWIEHSRKRERLPQLVSPARRRAGGR